MRVADRRARSTFWLDDAIVDRWGPWLGRYSQGTAALAIYLVLARHAGRDGESWPSVARLALHGGCPQPAVRRALHLLELAGLVAVYASEDAETGALRSNTYVLLTPPEEPPELGTDPATWPEVERERITVRLGADGRRMVEDWRDQQNARSTPCEKQQGGYCEKQQGAPAKNRRARARPLSDEGLPSEGQHTEGARPHDWLARIAWCTNDDPHRPPSISIEQCAASPRSAKAIERYRENGRRR